MIERKMLMANRTYTRPVKIRPEYIIVHSVGTAARPTKDRLWDSWNSAGAGKSVHGMVDADGCWLTLPLDVKGWHVGSKGNGLAVGFEVCEPGNIAYADAAHTKIDTAKYDPNDAAVRADFLRRYANAVELAAYMCRETGIAPGNVLCHQEAARAGEQSRGRAALVPAVRQEHGRFQERCGRGNADWYLHAIEPGRATGQNKRF